MSLYPAQEIDRSPEQFGALRATAENDVPGVFQPDYATEAQAWCPSTTQVRIRNYDAAKLQAFWDVYRQDATYNLTHRNCSSSVSRALEAALDGVVGRLHGPQAGWRVLLRLLLTPELWVASQIRKRALTMAWTPGLTLDYARALSMLADPGRSAGGRCRSRAALDQAAARGLAQPGPGSPGAQRARGALVARRAMILAILAGVTIVAAAGWGAGALWFQSPRGGAWRALSVACWLALAGAALLGLALEHAAPLWLFGAALLGLLAWWRLGCGRPMRAAGCPKWRGRRAATSTATGSRCTTCAISTGARAATTTCAGAPRPTICRVWNRWMSRCRTGAPAIAHALVSFGFGDGRHVVFSVEVRRKLGDAFSEIGASSASTSCRCWRPPKDSLRVRTNVRGEDGYLYRVHMPEGGARALFLAYVETANGLARQPRFYNTLTANCITIVYQLARRIVPGLPMDYRLLLSGYLPEYLYRIGALRGADSARAYRDAGRYTDRARATADAAQFSRNIRQGVPGE